MSLVKSNSRKCAVQALYQWQISGSNPHEIEKSFQDDGLLKNAQKTYFSFIFHGVIQQIAKLDEILTEFVDRPIDRIDPVERAILRIGAYELLNRLETPYRVIINEGVDLAKHFGAEGSYKYVNGILDKVSHKLRATEIQAKQKAG